jgi:hypothetical protein
MKLTAAHKELIKVLAAAAVEGFIQEQQQAETVKLPGKEPMKNSKGVFVK